MDKETRKKVLRGYSGLPKSFWIVPALTAWSSYRAITNGTYDTTGHQNSLTVGTTYAVFGIGWVISSFVFHDWWLMWREHRAAKRLVPDSEGMSRNLNHPDWVRAYQKKPRIQK